MYATIQAILNPFQRKGLALLIITILFSLPFGKGWGWVANAQIITTVAGNGTGAYVGDGGQCSAAELNNPWGVCFDSYNNMYIADYRNNVVRKVNSLGIINTVAGNGIQGFSGDGGQATNAELYFPNAVVIDSEGNLYIADCMNNCVRKVNTLGIITTIAGNGFNAGTGNGGYSGDGGQATAAELFSPYGLAFDAVGNMYIADNGNNVIRKVNTSGIIISIAGGGSNYPGDGGQATLARLNSPAAVALDVAGNLYIVAQNNNRIRKVNTSGIITTFAGGGTTGLGDGGQATAAELGYPTGATLDVTGNLYIADEFNNRIRMVNTLGIISTIAGNGTGGFSGDGGNATAAELYGPTGITLDITGNLYIADEENNRIRKVTNVGQTTSIKQYENSNEQVSIYPNPATNSLQVLLASTNENTELKIINMLGETVIQPATFNTQNFTVDVSQLATGVYIIELSNSSGKSVKRLIKE